MFELLAQTVLVVLFGAFSALLWYLIDFCIGEPHHGLIKKGRIFGRLGSYILRRYFEREEEIKKAGGGMNWWKARGACPTCTNVWACFIEYPFVAWALFDFSPVPTAIFFIPFVVVSNGIIRALIPA